MRTARRLVVSWALVALASACGSETTSESCAPSAAPFPAGACMQITSRPPSRPPDCDDVHTTSVHATVIEVKRGVVADCFVSADASTTRTIEVTGDDQTRWEIGLSFAATLPELSPGDVIDVRQTSRGCGLARVDELEVRKEGALVLWIGHATDPTRMQPPNGLRFDYGAVSCRDSDVPCSGHDYMQLRVGYQGQWVRAPVHGNVVVADVRVWDATLVRAVRDPETCTASPLDDASIVVVPASVSGSEPAANPGSS